MKKLLIWLFVIAMVVTMMISFSLAGCKKEAVEEEAAIAEEAEETTEEAEESVEETTEEVDLLFWSFGIYQLTAVEQELAEDEDDYYINEALARFADAYPNIKVEFFEETADKSTEMMTATGMAGSGPDVVALWGGQNVLNIKDILLPLNDFYSQEEMAENQGWDFHMEDGNYYGAPINGNVTMIFINKSLFDQAGVDLNEYDGTYDGLVAICEKFKNAGMVPIALGVADGWANSFLEGALYSSQVADAESEFKDIAAGNGNFSDNQELIAAFKAVQDLYSKGYFNNDVATIVGDVALTQFVNGQAAMFISGTWNLLSLQENLGDDLGMLPMPSISSDSVNFGVTIGGLGTDAIVVTSYSEHPEEAIKLVKFLRSYEEDKERLRKTGQLPSIKGDYSDAVVSPVQEDIAKITNVTYFLDNLLPGATSGEWFSLEVLMLTGQMSVEEFLGEWDNARDEALMAE